MATMHEAAHDAVPALRIQPINEAPIRADRTCVLYWMTAARRSRHNFALDRAIGWCRALGKPLVVLEALRCDYPWASDRLHRFVVQGMRDNQERFAATPVAYHPFVEPSRGVGKGLVHALGALAAVVITDRYPAFFHPAMTRAAGLVLDVRLEAIDGNGLLPVDATERVFTRAVDFRRFLHKNLLDHLTSPEADPLRNLDVPTFGHLPEAITRLWPASDLEALDHDDGLSALPIDHRVAPVVERGGEKAGRCKLDRFLDRRLARYATDRNAVVDRATSELSSYLHFGHVSTHEVFREVVRREAWTPAHVDPGATAKRSGWWGLSAAAESFLDELVTWREVGFNMSAKLEGYDRYDSLPAWSRTTLEEHLDDPREWIYDFETFDDAATHDTLWNAAQRELAREGRIHNYLRMLWGKKILEWSATPHDALSVMIELNNRYAVDGRDPSSYSGIFWCLGRYDRAWGPERPIFGKVRFMSSDSTRRKLDAKAYEARYPPLD